MNDIGLEHRFTHLDSDPIHWYGVILKPPPKKVKDTGEE